ncbi:MAG: hypothetical protein ACFFDF_25810, partial [Candidatus Odinarchaeota archaeon]
MKLNREQQSIKSLFRAIEQIDSAKLIFEALKLHYALKKYSSGILLWLKDEYPNCILIISPLYGNLFESRTSKFQQKMKETVDEYYRFVGKLRAERPKYYQEELNASRLILSSRPLQMLVNQDNYIKIFNKKWLDSLATYSNIVQDYTDKAIPVLITFILDVRKFLKDNINMEFSDNDFEFDFERVKTTEDLYQQIKMIPKMKSIRFVIK